MLALAIVDMGRGFSTGPESDGGLGLLSMRERVQFLGGTISVQSSPGHGTRVEARVPV
jgi:signal transduction histidine kinase